MNKIGRLSLAIGRYPEPHELKTVEMFLNQGIDVEFLAESKIIGQKSADVVMNGQLWEIKSPIGKGKRTIEKTFEKASRQSPNIILDLRRCHAPSLEMLSKAEKEWQYRKNIKRLIIITKRGELLDYRR